MCPFKIKCYIDLIYLSKVSLCQVLWSLPTQKSKGLGDRWARSPTPHPPLWEVGASPTPHLNPAPAPSPAPLTSSSCLFLSSKSTFPRRRMSCTLKTSSRLATPWSLPRCFPRMLYPRWAKVLSSRSATSPLLFLHQQVKKPLGPWPFWSREPEILFMAEVIRDTLARFHLSQPQGPNKTKPFWSATTSNQETPMFQNISKT